MSLHLTDCGVICPLGADKAEIARALFAGRADALTHRDG